MSGRRRHRRQVPSAAVAVAVLGLTPILSLAGRTEPAAAHGESTPTIVTVVDGVEPDVDGLDFKVLTGSAARLAAVNESGEELEILGPDGVPFLRIGPRGVDANVNSIHWYRSGNPDGQATPPPDARLDGPGRWQRVTERPSWAWFDHRLHPGTVQVTPEAIEAGRRARLDDWTVPARLGGEKLEIEGHVEYRPLLGDVVPELLGSSTPLPGVQVTLLQGQLPGLFLVNAGTEPVTVLGREGEPFARIGPRGVEVNLNSQTHIEDQVAKGEIATVRPAAARTATGGPPRWRRVSEANSYAWLDTRALYERQRPPREVSDGVERVVLERWTVPLRGGTRQVEVDGATSWVPFREPGTARAADSGDPAGTALAAGVLAVGLALAAAFAVRRRRSATDARNLGRVTGKR